MSEEAAAEGDSGEDECSEESLEEMVSEERESTNDGSIVIIAYEGESIYEVKNSEHDGEEQGKIQPYGGHIDRVDGVEESPLEAVIREISEEIGEEAGEIIIQYLKGKSHYKKVSSEYGDTYIFTVIIQDEAEWETIKAAPSKHDAGPRKLIDLPTLLDMPDEQFAWGYGPTIKSFMAENFETTNSYSLPTYKPIEFYSPKIDYKIAT
jgi:8-oxo-dGTP pyrophosphatase MutT (NUDIX family)